MALQIRHFLDNYLFSPVGVMLLFWVMSCGLLLVSGNTLIAWLKNRKGMKWAPREDTPDTHLLKAGVPSMGGIGIIGAALVAYTAMWVFVAVIEPALGYPNPPLLFFVNLGVFPTLVLLHAVLGYIDDHSKATNRGGLSSKAKLAGQVLLAVGFLVVVFLLSDASMHPDERMLDVHSKARLFSSWLPVLVALLIIIGTSNAVNLADGIDGLVAGLGTQVGLAFTLIMFERFTGTDGVGTFAAILFWMSLGGACLAFLAFNKFPAKVFMGDTGSLALGAALGAGTILTGTLALLPFIGFIFFVEMFSVIAQVAYFKFTKKRTGEGKRIFRRAPLHHHFELGGWSERRVVWTFWLVNFVTSGIGVALWKMHLLPRLL